MANILTNLPSFFMSSAGASQSRTSMLIDLAISFLVMLVSYIFVVGEDHICLKYARDKAQVPISEMWYGFKNHADDAIKIAFLLFIKMLTASVFLILLSYYWRYKNHTMPVLIITICAAVITACVLIRIALTYSMVFFILIDFPSKTPKQIMEESRNMTKNRMWQLFGLTCSFAGLYILGFLSFGLGMLWVRPYVRMTMTEYYLSLLPGKNVIDVAV